MLPRLRSVLTQAVLTAQATKSSMDSPKERPNDLKKLTLVQNEPHSPVPQTETQKRAFSPLVQSLGSLFFAIYEQFKGLKVSRWIGTNAYRATARFTKGSNLKTKGALIDHRTD